jgi:hypothetical protein
VTGEPVLVETTTRWPALTVEFEDGGALTLTDAQVTVTYHPAVVTTVAGYLGGIYVQYHPGS